jgi:hypothetical protein
MTYALSQESQWDAISTILKLLDARLFACQALAHVAMMGVPYPCLS